MSIKSQFTMKQHIVTLIFVLALSFLAAGILTWAHGLTLEDNTIRYTGLGSMLLGSGLFAVVIKQTTK